MLVRWQKGFKDALTEEKEKLKYRQSQKLNENLSKITLLREKVNATEGFEDEIPDLKNWNRSVLDIPFFLNAKQIQEEKTIKSPPTPSFKPSPFFQF
jgi:hypothetical protein